jgi:ubiquinol-cytochrome c reductase cytochrome c1 subunit
MIEPLRQGLIAAGLAALCAAGAPVFAADSSGTPDAAQAVKPLPSANKAPEADSSKAMEAQEEAGGHDGPRPARLSWSFAGPFGKYDTGQLQRGFKVYKEVCATCHSLTRVAFRTLAEEGGPEFSEAQVKALAASYQVKDEPDDKGEVKERPGRPSDFFPKVQYAGAGNPPDFSVLAKARSYSRGFPWFLLDAVLQYQEHGVDYIVALLEGYRDVPESQKKDFGDLYYNIYMPGHKIAMPPPLAIVFDDSGKPQDPNFYTDGTPVTTEQVSKDVAAFMMWTAEPKLVERKETGFKVMAFLILLAGLLYFTKKKVWADVHAAAHG